jgi:tRNA U34 5-methylaminomethyl-2-thiouridine-forming methyltransferase MnmC
MVSRPELTADGSYTFFSPEYGESYHSHSGAKLEAEKKFVDSCQLGIKASVKKEVFILDICYGLGYNTAAALAKIWQVNPRCKINLIALEIDPEVPKNALDNHLLDSWGEEIVQVLLTLANQQIIKTNYLDAELWLADARQLIQQVQEKKFLADAIFLDPFSPTKCPQLWAVEFLTLVAQCLNPEGILATYSCAAAVRSALQLAGLKIGPTVAVGRRSPGTMATFSEAYLSPLSPEESEHLQTRAAIPYRDPSLTDTPSQIIARREEEQALSNLENTSQWKKRWRL